MDDSLDGKPVRKREMKSIRRASRRTKAARSLVERTGIVRGIDGVRQQRRRDGGRWYRRTDERLQTCQRSRERFRAGFLWWTKGLSEILRVEAFGHR